MAEGRAALWHPERLSPLHGRCPPGFAMSGRAGRERHRHARPRGSHGDPRPAVVRNRDSLRAGSPGRDSPADNEDGELMARTKQRKAPTAKARPAVAKTAGRGTKATKARAAAKRATPAKSKPVAKKLLKAPAKKTVVASKTPVGGRAGKYTYSFGGGRADGRSEMKNLLGGKGANLAEMTQHRPAGPARLHHHHRGLHRLLRQRPASTRTTLDDEVKQGDGAGRADSSGKKFGDSAEPAAGLGPLRRARLDAGHDGHDPEPRPERPRRSRASRAARRTSASPTTPTAASCRCTRTSCSA